MSYSRWIESKWYIFPSVSRRIEVWRAGDELLCWTPDETFEDFLKKAAATLNHNEEYTADFMEMKEILEENMEEIQMFFKKWRKVTG